MVLEPYLMRAPCRWCATEGVTENNGYIRTVNGQDVVRCIRCERHCYNAPKTETGKPIRNVRSRPELKPGQRERILERDGGECFLCHRRDGILHAAHVMSVADAQESGWSEVEYMDDANLYAACEECNLGLKSRSMEARIFLRLIQLRIFKGQH
jgi:5-methylcytosine-specific restriction endonuclease McrA